MSVAEKAFSTRIAGRLAGMKPTMIDYLARSGVVVPSVRARPGHGLPRLYSFGDVVLLRTLQVLLSRGLPVRQLRVAIHKNRAVFKSVTVSSAVKRFLITDGKELLFEDDAGRLVDLTKDGQMAFAFIADFAHARAEVSSKLKESSVKSAAAAAAQGYVCGLK
jgi:DNA-binding transcriptional MerR regulator